MRRRVLAAGFGSCLIGLLAWVTPALADSTLPTFVPVNFAPIVSSTSYNYDLSTGNLTPSTATATVSSTSNAVQASISDPAPPDPNGYGTFIGTAEPYRFMGQTVVYEQSTCASFPLYTCLSDGTFTYGYFVLYNMRGKTLDQLTNLATQYYVYNGDCGGGSPRFSVILSNGAEVHVYMGPFPDYTGCPKNTWLATGNLVTDPEPRWDSSQLGGTFYGTYSEAVALANAQGLTINSIFLATDSGWFNGNQTFLFRSIENNGVTRFPN